MLDAYDNSLRRECSPMRFFTKLHIHFIFIYRFTYVVLTCYLDDTIAKIPLRRYMYLSRLVLPVQRCCEGKQCN